ncbi:hypothetical protein HNY73_008762 [Argiope bruennichi]|uniref:Uncharacterized protein n=1 Tax=Argiope bruennichi TaxID=94029 RepID=A0A8T0F7F6_ARGBR|nr:hypothetical protein HNY73_008762 [Argiope bruennichi]
MDYDTQISGKNGIFLNDLSPRYFERRWNIGKLPCMQIRMGNNGYPLLSGVFSMPCCGNTDLMGYKDARKKMDILKCKLEHAKTRLLAEGFENWNRVIEMKDRIINWSGE